MPQNILGIDRVPQNILGIECLEPNLVHSLAFRNPATKIAWRLYQGFLPRMFGGEIFFKKLPRVTLGASVVKSVQLGVSQVEILKVVALIHPGVCCERPPETRVCLQNIFSS